MNNQTYIKAIRSYLLSHSADPAQDFADNLHTIMRAHGITQTELARRMGTSRQNVSDILTGGRVAIAKTVDKLAEALGCEANDLLAVRSRRTDENRDQYINVTIRVPVEKLEELIKMGVL